RLDTLIREWIDLMNDQTDLISSWGDQLPEMFDHLSAAGTNITAATRDFVTRWCRDAIDDPESALASDTLADLITSRERTLKRSSARLTNTSPLLNWDGELLGTEYLDYRWSYARRLIIDCQHAEGPSNAES
ncbi:MAG: DUF6361 family protein, partial [Gordonia sp. (in: high G+C Gram-positive bacteria)]|uniref:DUF6361 family protein n=1 Tax=Gordonia sp. (in: high G+C Gram-positive bacteria) TaxID=84139 RepID=UPI003BB610DC